MSAVPNLHAPDPLDLLFRDDDQHRYELVDGQLIDKPMVSILHGLLMAHLSRLLLTQLEVQGLGEQFWVLADPLAKIREDHWRRPDIAVIRAEDAEPWKYVMPGHWPQLCIELVSAPSQDVEELLDKCKIYHAQGVSHCWVLEPVSRTAWQYDKDTAPEWRPRGSSLTALSLQLSFPIESIWLGLHNKRG